MLKVIFNFFRQCIISASSERHFYKMSEDVRKDVVTLYFQALKNHIKTDNITFIYCICAFYPLDEIVEKLIKHMDPFNAKKIRDIASTYYDPDEFATASGTVAILRYNKIEDFVIISRPDIDQNHDRYYHIDCFKKLPQMVEIDKIGFNWQVYPIKDIPKNKIK